MQEPVALLKANRVWGALRGTFHADSLSVSIEAIFSLGALRNQAQQNGAVTLGPLQNALFSSRVTSGKHATQCTGETSFDLFKNIWGLQCSDNAVLHPCFWG